MLVELMRNVAEEIVETGAPEVIEVVADNVQWDTLKKAAIVTGGIAVAAGVTYFAVKGGMKLYDKIKNKKEEKKA